MLHPEIRKHLRHNTIVNLLDGAFFGSALGFASFVTVLPLFVSSLTDSAVLIGLIPSIHLIGWQLPQLFTANRLSQEKVYRPAVLKATIHERLPFLGLALLAWYSTSMDSRLTLLLTFTLLIWQGLGGGFTANAWQSMIGKIIPSNRRGTFFGAQSAAANLLSSGAAVAAGLILAHLAPPKNFSVVFLLAAASMGVSFFFLSRTREPEYIRPEPPVPSQMFWANLGTILKRDGNFRWFLAARMLGQLAIVAFAFYTVYVVRYHGLSEVEVGIMTAVLMGAQTLANPFMGWIGDHWSQRSAYEIGAGAAALSAILAWQAPSPGWFYLVFGLAGVASAAMWTVTLAMTLKFGQEAERPVYIGLSNTLVAPATILAPLLGGLLADSLGYTAAFQASALGGIGMVVVLQFFVRDPSPQVTSHAPSAVDGKSAPNAQDSTDTEEPAKV
jgi:MFS family permease